MKNSKNFILISLLNILIFRALAQSNDQIAIKSVIEKETKTWRLKDVKGHADCWVKITILMKCEC